MQALIRGYCSTLVVFGSFFLLGVIQNLNSDFSFRFLWMKEIGVGWFLSWMFVRGILVGVMIVLLIQAVFLSFKTPELSKFDLDKPL